MFNRVHSSVFIIITLVMSLVIALLLLLYGNKFWAVPSAFDQFLGFLAGSTVTILSFRSFCIWNWFSSRTWRLNWRWRLFETPFGSSELWHQPVRLLTTRGEGSCDLCFSRNVELQSHSDAACKQDTPLHRANHPVPSHPDFRFHTTWATASSNPINFQLPMDVDGYSNSKIIITCYHQICWFGLPLLAFTHWCLCMVSFLPESCHCLAISRWNPRRGTSLNIVSTREHSPRLNCEDLPTWRTKTHSLHEWQIVPIVAKSKPKIFKELWMQ